MVPEYLTNKLKQLYLHKYTPRFFYKKFDGGKDSGVVGYFLIEWKPVFSIGLLRFSEGSRENFHSHSFLGITWWIKGCVEEEVYNGEKKIFKPSLIPKITKRNKIHRVKGLEVTYAITFRGPWSRKGWFEITPDGKKIHMNHGRKITLVEKIN